MVNNKRGRKAPLTFNGFSGKNYKSLREAISVFKGLGEELGQKGLTEVVGDLLVVEQNLRDTLNKMQLCSKAIKELQANIKQYKGGQND